MTRFLEMRLERPHDRQYTSTDHRERMKQYYLFQIPNMYHFLNKRLRKSHICRSKGKFIKLMGQKQDDSLEVVLFRFFHDSKFRFDRFVIERLKHSVLVGHANLLRFTF